jgi:hypothetical protein
MAGAAIFGVITAMLRTPDLGALIRYISVGIHFELDGTNLLEMPSAAYEGFNGQIVGLIMLLVLGVACFLLARLGAKWSMAADDDEG